MHRTNTLRAAWAAAGLSLLFAVLAVALYWVNINRAVVSEEARLGGLNLVMAVTFPPVGLLILRARDRHRVGWLFMAIGLTQGTRIFLSQYLFAVLNVFPGALPINFALFWLKEFIWLPGFCLLLLLLAIFPDGSPPTPGSRRLVKMVAAACILGLLWSIIEPLTDPNPEPYSSLTGGSLGVSDLLLDLAVMLMVIIPAAAAFSLAGRLSHSVGVERQQLKYFAFAGGTFGLVFLVLSVMSAWPVLNPALMEDPVYRAGLNLMKVLSPLCAALIPLAVGAAVLRYRLYGIDVIIRRTLIYSVLTIALALIYAGGVLSLQTLFQWLTQQERSEIAVVVSTLAIAALFSPLRGWVQGIIDRRFYRQRYDSEQALAAFSAGLRQEVDLNQIVARTEEVVQATLQPEIAFVWLAPAADDPQERDR